MDRKIEDYAEQLWNAMVSDDIESLSKITNDSSMIKEIEKRIEHSKYSKGSIKKNNLEENDSFSIIGNDEEKLKIGILKDLGNSAESLKSLLDVIQESSIDTLIIEFNEKRMMYAEIVGIILGFVFILSQRNGKIVLKGLQKEDERFLKYNMEMNEEGFSNTVSIID